MSVGTMGQLCAALSVMWESKDPVPVILEGLRRLEYRGYDSRALLLPADQMAWKYVARQAN